MSVLVSIAGLAFLILIHEAGHFFTARAVGMRPRRFYIGFPPAVLKRTRNGIEYGLGAIPLGGYVKIPGMHRPAPSDLDVHFGRRSTSRRDCSPAVERVKRALAQNDFEGARAALGDARAGGRGALRSRRTRGEPPTAALSELADALGTDAYWRQRTWKRLAVIAAGPGTNIALRDRAPGDRLHDRRSRPTHRARGRGHPATRRRRRRA